MNPFIENILSRLGKFFSPEIISAMVSKWVTGLIVAAAVFTGFYLAWQVLRLALKPALRRARADETTTAFVETVTKFLILLAGIVTALDAAGIQTSAVLTSLGIAGLTIGFAARDALSNLISGILIFIDRPFVIGDLVEIDNQYGRVEKITLRSTRIITTDGKMLAVPNTEVINKTVASFTNFPHLRLDIDITIGVAENVEKVRDVLLSVVREDPDYMSDPQPRVVVSQLNDYNVGLTLQAWLENERQHMEKRFELREKAYCALSRAGVDMPFETIQLTPLNVKLEGEHA